MSLLMDALRRAEQAKEQAQTEQRDEAAPDGTASAVSAAAPVLSAARLVSSGMPAGKAAAAGSGLAWSIDEVTPASDISVDNRGEHNRQHLPQTGAAGPVTTVPDQAAALRRLATRARQSRRRRLGYMVGGGIMLLIVVLVFVYFEVVVATGRLHEPQVAMPLSVQEAVQSVPADTAPDTLSSFDQVTNTVVARESGPAAAPVMIDADKSGAAPVKPRHRSSTATVEVPPQAAIAADAPASSPVIIVHNETEDPLQNLLARAFDDYQAGNDQQAETGYRQALAQDANSRDALLGLAAVAQRGGRVEEAGTYYRRLIEINPLDSTPIAGLIGLRNGSDPVQDESRIKLLLKQEPAAAHLYFALGTLYATQSRWAEAQQTFFDAYRHDPVNADYAFNLAICLDRLGQTTAALGYYRRALELTRGGTVSFRESEVVQRIGALAAAERGGSE